MPTRSLVTIPREIAVAGCPLALAGTGDAAVYKRLGTDHTGCRQLAATIAVGAGPFRVLVDDYTHTVDVVNNADGDAPGTVSVINAATCNGIHTTGCCGHFPVMAADRSPLIAELDPSTGHLYFTDFSSADVAILNGATCNATITNGCQAAPGLEAVGSQPFGLAISQYTVYVTTLFHPATCRSSVPSDRTRLAGSCRRVARADRPW